MYCNKLAEPLIRRIEIENKTLDEIAGEVCGDTVKNPRHKIIRIIKLLLVNEYLNEHAQTLGYHTDKAVRQKSTTDEVMKGKLLTEVEDSDNSGEANSVTPVSSCQTTVQAVNTEHVGEAKGQEQVTACCQKQAVRKKIVSEEEILEEHDDAPVIEVSNLLVEALKELIKLFSIEDVKKFFRGCRKRCVRGGIEQKWGWRFLGICGELHKRPKFRTVIFNFIIKLLHLRRKNQEMIATSNHIDIYYLDYY